MGKDVTPQSGNNEEIDLGKLFSLIGNAFSKLYSLTGNLLRKMFMTFVWFVFFIKKHFLKIVIAGVIGVVLGVIQEKTSDPIYRSYCIVKQNYKTGEVLYNSVDYLNALITQKDSITLANLLNIRSEEVSSIIGIRCESVLSENEKIRSYDMYLKSLDTTLASSITYKDYLENDKPYDHELQRITIRSKESTNFEIVFNQIIETINTNEFFKREQEKNILELTNRKIAIENSLIKSDSLQSTYKRVLEKSLEKPKSSEIGITFEGSNGVEKTKEYNLYLKDIELRNDLVGLERALADNEKIIEIITSKQDKGIKDNKMNILNKRISPKMYYGILFSIVTFFTLLGIKFLNYLDRFKNRV